MAKSSDQFEDQAQILRNRMHTKEDESHNASEQVGEYPIDKEGINVLDLPPRSEAHKGKKTGYTWKVQYPLIRLLIVLFIILILFIPIYNIWGKQGEDNATLSTLKSAKASDANYMMELTRRKGDPDSDFSLQNKEEESETGPERTEEEQDVSEMDAVATKDGATVTFDEYVVKEGDTLYSIAMKFYKSKDGERKIVQANHLNGGEEIYVGQTLLIPQ